MLFFAKHQHESTIGGISYHPSLLKILPPSRSPTLYVVTEPQFEFPESYGKFPLAIYFTYDSLYVIPSFHPTLSFMDFPSVHKSILYVCVSIAALQIYIFKILFKLTSFVMVSLIPKCKLPLSTKPS